MTDHTRLVREEIEQSERTRDVAPSGREVRKSREASSVYSLRLPEAVIAQLNEVADTLDVPVSALIRGFILDGLAAREGGDVRSALDKLERDLSEVRRKALTT
ncbi:MAG: hypothetical protein H7269_03645 [Cellulomonas sp.]|nr:hypothetical protein [Cellulomonas sp.]